MIRLLFAASVALLLPHVVCAQEEEPPKVLFACNAVRSEVSLTLRDTSAHEHRARGTRIVDAAALVNYSKEDEHGDVSRTGSKVLIRKCGRLTVRFRGGFYNTNIQGEMGAADDYPIVEVLDGSRSVTGRIAMGPCDPTESRYSLLVACPGNWATVVVVSRRKGAFTTRLVHSSDFGDSQ